MSSSVSRTLLARACWIMPYNLREHRKNSPRSVRNKIDYTQIFLHHFGLPSLLLGKDLPKYTKKTVRKYNMAQLQKMFDSATIALFAVG
jgi:hypothetical protein